MLHIKKTTVALQRLSVKDGNVTRLEGLTRGGPNRRGPNSISLRNFKNKSNEWEFL